MGLEEPAIVVADGAAAFVDAIVKLWDDPERLTRVSAAGLAAASTRFSFEAQRAAFVTLLADLGVTTP